MILDIIVIHTDDGVTAEIPSLKGCESWSSDEDGALEKVLEMAKFYLELEEKKFKVDLARKNGNKKVYKLIFDKESD